MYIVGLIGAVLVCIGYFLLEKGKVKPHSYRYLTINVIGGVCLLAALFSPFQMSNIGPAILQTIMIGISIYGFFKAGKKSGTDKS